MGKANFTAEKAQELGFCFIINQLRLDSFQMNIPTRSKDSIIGLIRSVSSDESNERLSESKEIDHTQKNCSTQTSDRI